MSDPLQAPEHPAMPGPLPGISIIIPAHNEESGVARQVAEVRAVMEKAGRAYELIVVDDGSTDGTAEQARQTGVRLLRLRENRGYGGALKAGVSATRFDWIVIIDADCTYPSEAIPVLLESIPDYDMVVGARLSPGVHVPLARRPAKWFLTKLAMYLAQKPIPDLNSGLRVMRKSLLEKYESILPNAFSLTTTITLALLCNGYAVRYIPISYRQRQGSSKIRAIDAGRFLVQVLRTITLFNPLRVFIPLGLIPFLTGLGKLAYDLTKFNVSDSAVMGILAAILIWCFGLLADQNAQLGINRR